MFVPYHCSTYFKFQSVPLSAWQRSQAFGMLNCLVSSGSGLVTSDVGAIKCGATCSDAYGKGTVITLTAEGISGSQFTGWLGPCSGGGLTCQFTVKGPVAVTATFAFPPLGATPYDIDGNGAQDAVTDALLALRHLFGLTGSSLIGGAVGPGATRSTEVSITSYLGDIKPVLVTI